MKRLLAAALNALYPESLTCALCGGELYEPGSLCADCADKVPPVLNPCPGCGRSTAQGGLCRSCLRFGPVGEGAAVAFVYEDRVRQVLTGFKFRDDTGACAFLAGGMASAALKAGFAGRFDCVVPVPMHWIRRLHRGYNQTELLARRLCEQFGVPMVKGVLARPVYTPALSTAGSASAGRRQNALKSFGPGKGSLAGKRVLLVDDILTTGSTLRACAGILKGVGAKEVLVLAAAAVPERGNQIPMVTKRTP